MTRLTAVPDPKQAAQKGSAFDCVLLVGPDPGACDLPALRDALRAAAAVDRGFGARAALWPAPAAAGGRLVTAPTGPLDRDHDDVRRYADAAAKGARIARDAGATKVLLLVQPAAAGRKGGDDRYAEAAPVAVRGALAALWQPLEAREAHGQKDLEPVAQLGIAALDGSFDKRAAALEQALDDGIRLARDLCGADPERMAPQRFAQHVQQALRGTGVKVTVVSTPTVLKKDYPLLSAVARASMPVARHRPCVIRLEYGGKTAKRTLLFAGKGVTYDTGGADLKVGGHMAGMMRDKGGAAAVAGLVLAAARLKLPGVRVVAELGMVRNSIGSDAYVADEIIRSHGGARVRVGNTDAEGRMVLADLLSHLRVRAQQEKAPHLFTIATLTGHAVRAVGPYSIALDNGPARAAGMAETLAAAGDRHGDPFEVSRLRREDWDFVQPGSRADDVLQCNSAPSSATARGHQFPMAFLCIAAGMTEHGGDGKKPLCYTHLDIAGSADAGGDASMGTAPGRPVAALLHALLRS
ncbi:MAG: leucyl aminopeptidase family protein [Planctomycetota bacterium]